MSLLSQYGYNKNANTYPTDQFTTSQGVGAGLGALGLLTY